MPSENLIAERRASPRFADNSPLYVRGIDAFGIPFSENTKIVDVSEGGISFRIHCPIWEDMVLTLDIGHSEPPAGHYIDRRKAKARVLRILENNQGEFFIGARFEN